MNPWGLFIWDCFCLHFFKTTAKTHLLSLFILKTKALEVVERENMLFPIYWMSALHCTVKCG